MDKYRRTQRLKMPWYEDIFKIQMDKKHKSEEQEDLDRKINRKIANTGTRNNQLKLKVRLARKHRRWSMK